MSFETRPGGGRLFGRHDPGTRRWWLMAVAAGALATGWLAPSAALAAPHEHVTGMVRAWHGARKGDTPSEVIDAQTNPQEAGQELNTGCADLSNCSWQATSSITTGYGPSQILGDALYNCSPASDEQAYADTAVGISEEREESTSVSETLSVEIGLGFLGFEKSTAEFELFSKQSASFSTEVSTTSGVEVPPMWKGWTETRVLTAFVTGNAYVTDGLNHLIEVKNMQLDFPGYQNPNDTQDSPVLYIQKRTAMTPEDIASRCNTISGLGAGTPSVSSRAKQLATPTGSFELALCQRGGGCATRTVAGTLPRGIDQATLTLTRAGRTYATGADTGGRIQLTTRRRITAGRYTLTISQPRRDGPRRAQTTLRTIVPIIVR